MRILVGLLRDWPAKKNKLRLTSGSLTERTLVPTVCAWTTWNPKNQALPMRILVGAFATLPGKEKVN